MTRHAALSFRYGGMPVRSPYSKEAAIRILLANLQRQAAAMSKVRGRGMKTLIAAAFQVACMAMPSIAAAAASSCPRRSKWHVRRGGG